MNEHIVLKKKLKDNKLISNIDHLIACGNLGFTDLRFTKLDKKITPESKYYLAMNIDNKPIILCHPNLFNLRKEIDERMISKKYIEGYDEKCNRVLLHYKGDGKFRIGNKKGSYEFITSFDICNFNKLAKRYNYKVFIDSLPNIEKHRALQILISELGISQGYYVKLGRNDLTPILSSDYSLELCGKVLSISDLELSHITEHNTRTNIDLIDVLWYDPLTKQIVAAFEIERSRNYDAVLRRFSSIPSNFAYNPYIICVGDDYVGFKNSMINDMYYNWFKDSSLNYLNLDDLYSILDVNKKYNQFVPIETLFQHHLLNPIPTRFV